MALSPSTSEVALRHIVDGTLYRFRDWPNPVAPRVAAGIYSVAGARLGSVGMSGRGLSASALERLRAKDDGAHGLAARLASHASGRRSGDQFCLGVTDRLVLPSHVPPELEEIVAGLRSMDSDAREFVRRELPHRFAVVEDGTAALSMERRKRARAWAAGYPFWARFQRRSDGRKVEPRNLGRAEGRATKGEKAWPARDGQPVRVECEGASTDRAPQPLRSI